MIYRKETPFDKLSFECLIMLEKAIRDTGCCVLDLGLHEATKKEIIAALKSKIQRNPQYFRLEDYGIND